jgi:hypothetical protein
MGLRILHAGVAIRLLIGARQGWRECKPDKTNND